MESIELYFCRSLKLHFIQTRPFTQNSLTHTLSLSVPVFHFPSLSLTLSHAHFLFPILHFLFSFGFFWFHVVSKKHLSFSTKHYSIPSWLRFLTLSLLSTPSSFAIIPWFHLSIQLLSLSLWVFFSFLSALLCIK